MTKTTIPQTRPVDPATLKLTKNIRQIRRSDRYKKIVRSIREVGLLQPPVVVETESGELEVRLGQHRTLAAVEVGLTEILVLVLDATGDDLMRILQQYAENKHRIELTREEELSTFEQLSMFGLSADQIAQRTINPATMVSKSLKVASSPDKRKKFVSGEWTLQRAAALLDFEDDPEATRELQWVDERKLEERAASLRRKRAVELARAEASEPYERMGHPVLDAKPWGQDPPFALHRLRTKDDAGVTADMIDRAHLAVYLDDDEQYFHRTTGERLAIQEIDWGNDDSDDDEDEEQDGSDKGISDSFDADSPQPAKVPLVDVEPRLAWTPVYFCTDPAAYEFTVSGRKLESAEEKKAKNAKVRSHNAAWREEQPRRIEWLRRFLERPEEPVGAPEFVTYVMANWPDEIAHGKAHSLTGQLLTGTEANRLYKDGSTLNPHIESASAARQHMMQLAMAICGLEAAMTEWAWREIKRRNIYFLRFIASQGYELSRIERIACGEEIELLPPKDTTTPVPAMSAE
ncbi:ParB/RepB/Spo0J family partition protein [Nocardia sp. CA-135953]|uniref:ParB/RepB/Spo0J family partition protein n=1 Tax=Nocardia sp. CA-135953 TaxID=3239978 RepID=UPI003D968B3F